MLLSEFIDRTGYQPTAEEYAAIEREYYHFNGDKDAYCKAWCKANPTKAGTLWAAIKEQQRIGKVFDRLVAHIVKYAKRRDFSRDTFYHMTYADMQQHADWVMEQIKAKDRSELRDMMYQLNNANAVRSGWSSKTWDYYHELQRIV